MYPECIKMKYCMMHLQEKEVFYCEKRCGNRDMFEGYIINNYGKVSESIKK